MRFRPSRPLLIAAGVAFAISALLYAGIAMVASWPQVQPEVQLGFDNEYQPNERAELITSVYKDSPAEKAGLLPGDCIIAVDGVRVTDSGFQNRVWLQHKPGDQIHLVVQRAGAQSPLFLTGTFRRRRDPSADFFSRQVNLWFPLPFLIVGLAVLCLRPTDLNAWLLAVLFCGVAFSRALPPPSPRPSWWPVVMAYQAFVVAMAGPLFYRFYARFPARSPLDRYCPWLKWALAALGLIFGLGGMQNGGVRLPPPFARWLPGWDPGQVGLVFVIACLTLGLISFAANFVTSRDLQARRKIRVMFWGTLISLGPNLVKLLLQNFSGIQPPPWLNDILQAMLWITPVAFAYAVLVHRVVEIPVLLKRSARYLLVQRGFTFLLSLASIGITLLFALSLPRYLQAAVPVNQTANITLGAVFGTALLWSGVQIHRRISDRIDRAFFRRAYDARIILEDLADKTRTATDRTELARLLGLHLTQALQPAFLSVELHPGPPPQHAAPECVVPILGRGGRQLGAIVLGARLSEEPYSGEDQRLLASVASQAATALENIGLAEEIAERIETERRAAREMEIARDVQSRLLPQSPPHLNTLECAACCIQARAVGGDYYDFLDLGPDRAGLVLADVSGKGVHAALLVANLEAYMRSQCSIAAHDPVRILQQVNQMLYRSTAPQHFATVFFGIYDDSARELLYVNCGHNPPIWLRHDGAVARLEPTATVIGAFDRWHASDCRARFEPGDLLAVYSDGVTEAPRGEEEFGERRLIDALAACNGSPASAIVSTILRRVQEFSQGAQADDLTLLIARAR
jgi:sigma-B regulation protein RsbU (phosphoserine phosphatase)